jgi:hypothetical protein
MMIEVGEALWSRFSRLAKATRLSKPPGSRSNHARTLKLWKNIIREAFDRCDSGNFRKNIP